MDRIRELEAEVERLKGALLRMERGAFDPTLQSIAEQIPDNVILIDREHRIRYINWTVPELTPERVLGKPICDYVPAQHRAAVVAMYEQAFATGLPQRLEYQYYSADGTTSKWVTRTVPLRQADGAIERLLLISTDITEREEAARDRDRFFQLSLDMLCVATLHGFFKRVSPSFTSVLGWSSEELVTAPLLDFVHPDDRPATRGALEALGRGEHVSSFENRYRVKAGGYRTLEWSSIADVEGGLIYAAARDVTERRELEAALAQSRKMESIGHVLGGVGLCRREKSRCSSSFKRTRRWSRARLQQPDPGHSDQRRARGGCALGAAGRAPAGDPALRQARQRSHEAAAALGSQAAVTSGGHRPRRLGGRAARHAAAHVSRERSRRVS